MFGQASGTAGGSKHVLYLKRIVLYNTVQPSIVSGSKVRVTYHTTLDQYMGLTRRERSPATFQPLPVRQTFPEGNIHLPYPRN
jgi:hypothetical protein